MAFAVGALSAVLVLDHALDPPDNSVSV
jgi:hypothetical protein